MLKFEDKLSKQVLREFSGKLVFGCIKPKGARYTAVGFFFLLYTEPSFLIKLDVRQSSRQFPRSTRYMAFWRHE
jgi:hypothetical protein